MKIDVGTHCDISHVGWVPDHREVDDLSPGRAHERREIDPSQPGLHPSPIGHGPWGGEFRGRGLAGPYVQERVDVDHPSTL